MKARILFSVISLFQFSFLSADIQFAGIQTFIPKKVYRTRQEIRQLFTQLGLEYLDSMEYEYKDILKTTIATQLRDPNTYLELFEKYNEDIQYNKFAPMCVAYINDWVGHGIFATAPINKGDFVGIYTGIIKMKKPHEDTMYTWDYPTDPIHPELTLVCDATYAGNELRFSNHSFAPNTEKVNILCNNHWYVCYIAKEDIAFGEQITVSYGKGYWLTTNRPYYDPFTAFLRMDLIAFAH